MFYEIKVHFKHCASIWQSVFFWITTTPSILILNNITWKYLVFEWIPNKQDIVDLIDKMKQ